MSVPMFLAERESLLADRVRLDGAEGRHAARARRLATGERADVSDGAGLVAECVVARVGRDELDLDVLRRHDVAQPKPRVVVTQALPKGDRGERAVEEMTEVGVDAVVPWAASRCVTQWRPGRDGKGVARWRAKAREAAKQARRARLPRVSEPADTAGVAAALAASTLGVVLEQDADARLAHLTVPVDGEVVLVVGPEGGLSPDELRLFQDAGAVPARLGPSVLRTSTAGVAAASVVLARSGRW